MARVGIAGVLPHSLKPRTPKVRAWTLGLGLTWPICRHLDAATSPGHHDPAAGRRSIPTTPANACPSSLFRLQLDVTGRAHLQGHDCVRRKWLTINANGDKPWLVRQTDCVVTDIDGLKVTGQVPRLSAPGQGELDLAWLRLLALTYGHTHRMPQP
jgi:hypothetical protein